MSMWNRKKSQQTKVHWLESKPQEVFLYCFPKLLSTLNKIQQKGEDSRNNIISERGGLGFVGGGGGLSNVFLSPLHHLLLFAQNTIGEYTLFPSPGIFQHCSSGQLTGSLLMIRQSGTVFNLSGPPGLFPFVWSTAKLLKGNVYSRI